MPKPTIKDLSQEELIMAFRQNDSDILQSFYQDGFLKVKRFVLANQGNEDQAKDIFQDSFLVVWQNAKEGKFTPRNNTALQGYLFQIAKNKWLDWVKSSQFKKEKNLGDSSYPESIEEEIDQNLEPEFELLQAGFQNLGETCQQVLRYFYFDKKSLEEIASEFGWSSKTVKNNKYRCMEKLRKWVFSK